MILRKVDYRYANLAKGLRNIADLRINLRKGQKQSNSEEIYREQWDRKIKFFVPKRPYISGCINNHPQNKKFV